MKKITTIILILSMTCALLTLSGCGNDKNQNNDKISLTVDNCEDYISVDSAKVYGTGNSFWSSNLSAYMYYSAEGTVSISGLSNYEYNNVVVNITIHFSYGTDNRSIPISVYLNKGGNGKATNTIKLDGWTNDWIQKYAYYEITSVSGSISKI